MDQLILDAPAPKERRLEYAGFWIRVVAFIADWIVLFVINRIVGFVFFEGGVSDLISSTGFTSTMAVYYLLTNIGVAIAYFALLESSQRQGTLGKMAVGIRVGDEKGEVISFMNAVGRYLAKFLSALIFFIGFIMVAFDLRNQGLHDKLAST